MTPVTWWTSWAGAGSQVTRGGVVAGMSNLTLDRAIAPATAPVRASSVRTSRAPVGSYTGSSAADGTYTGTASTVGTYAGHAPAVAGSYVRSER